MQKMGCACEFGSSAIVERVSAHHERLLVSALAGGPLIDRPADVLKVWTPREPINGCRLRNSIPPSISLLRGVGLEKALGPEHPKVATSLNNLATFYHNQAQYAKAEPLY